MHIVGLCINIITFRATACFPNKNVHLKKTMLFFLTSHRARSTVWNASISRTALIAWKSVPMACKAPTASSSSTQKPTTNAIPATATAPRGEYSRRRGVGSNRRYSVTEVTHSCCPFVNQKLASSTYKRGMKPNGNRRFKAPWRRRHVRWGSGESKMCKAQY